ncbi:leucine-rich repeat-containing protein 43 [Phaethornis superciliosus]
MAGPGCCTVSAAFREHLRCLALQDFPCGLGSWNKSRWDALMGLCRGQSGLGTARAGQEEPMVVGEESPEALMELLRDQHSPWALPPGCNPQDQHLREVALLTPKAVCGPNLFRMIRSLRIVGKEVEEVDEGLLQFKQLEELILSTNQISRITSANLPQTLKVLELCCNAVADLQELCAQPLPELQHLGLGYNRLCSPWQDKYLTANCWPNLVSLDLSFNSLTDLLDLVSQLSSLHKLRILLLQGNPLALIPTYRGFLVDSLPKLLILDDIHIEPEERDQFHGLAGQPELSRSEARVVVSIGEIKGVPVPCQQLEEGSKDSVITYSYCVTYEFAEGEEIQDRSSTEFQDTKIHQSTVVATLDMDISAQDTEEARSPQEPAATVESEAHSAKVFATPGMPWEDTIDCSYRKEHIVKDLVGLKSYLAAGTVVSVVEEKVVSWPVVSDPEENEVVKGKAKKGRKGSTKGPVPKEKPKKEKKQKKKKPCEFRSDPPIRRTLGTVRVTLETLVATEDLVATVCDFGVLMTEQPPNLEKQDKKKGKDKSKKPKEERANQASRKTSESAKGKNKNTVCAELEEGEVFQPVPLTVQFQMQLLRWPLADATQSQESETTAAGKSQ